MRDAARRITQSDSNGLPGRTALFAYDDAGRLTGDAVAGRDALESPGLAHENLYTPAEFRQARATRSALSDEQIARLDAAGEGAMVPRGWTATENAAHAIESRTVGATEFDYVNAGGRRVSDGVWSAEYDELGRLTARARTTGEARRIEYQYDPNDRLIGRIALQPAGEGTWSLETRTTVLARDGLPAETTFVWDPVTDRLLAIYEAGKSIGAIDPNAGLLKQYLHGDQGYDDPTHVFVRNTAPKSGEPAIFRHRIVVDPLAGGSVTTVVDPEGHLVERVLYADAYGDAPRYLHGAVVDKISVHVEKDGTGAIAKIVFRARLSERIDPASLATGARLEAVRGDGSTTPAPAAVTPELFEETTVQWTLTGAQWQSFAADATSIRLSITADLRTPAWGNRGPMPAPGWAQTLFGVEATAAEPVVWRESVARIDSILGALAAGDAREQALYEIPELYLAAAEEMRAGVGIGHHAYPFAEPANDDVYVRARWYEPESGDWLVFDVAGYDATSSNLFGAFRSDAVNILDPDGREPITAAAFLSYLGWVVVNTAIDVAIDYAFNEAGDWLSENETAFDWHASLQQNFAVNLATGGFGGKLAKIANVKKLGKFARFGILRHPGGRKIIGETLEFGADVLVTGSAAYLSSDQGAAEAYGSAAFGRLLGGKAAAHLRFMRDDRARMSAKGYLGEALTPLVRRLKGEEVVASRITFRAAGERADFDFVTRVRKTGALRVVETKTGRSAVLHDGQSAVARAIQRTGTARVTGRRSVSTFRDLGIEGGSYRRGLEVNDIDFQVERFDRLALLIDVLF